MRCWRQGLLILLLVGANAKAMEARPNADDPVLEQRLTALAADLRCVVCQNESLAESRAPLAQDLRQEVRDLMKQGKSDPEVIDYLRIRYGDFVLYRPPFKPVTYLLWVGPLLFLSIGGLVWVIAVQRHRSPAAVSMIDDDALSEAAALLRHQRSVTSLPHHPPHRNSP
jgi:cytochrome c-type biogenesis protein CcmH